MATVSSSALWATRYRIADPIDILRLIDELFWDRLDLHVPYQQEGNWCWAATALAVPLAPAPGFLEPGRPYAEPEFAAALRGPAERVLSAEGPSGG